MFKLHISREVWVRGKKNKNPNLFSCQQSISWQWPFLVCVCRGWEGSPWTLCPWWVFGGRWRHVEVPPHPGVPQAPSSGFCLCCGQSRAGEAVRVLCLLGMCDHHQICLIRKILLFLRCVRNLSYQHHHLSAATLVPSSVLCACRGSSQEPNFSVPNFTLYL